MHNKAESTGGGVYLHCSELICQRNCTFHSNYAHQGGGIHAIDSAILIVNDWKEVKHTILTEINTRSLLLFINNFAHSDGGGLSLEGNSKLQGPLGQGYGYIIKFINNTAHKGGAIFVDDYTNSIPCKKN